MQTTVCFVVVCSGSIFLQFTRIQWIS